MSDDAENEELLSLERARADIEIIQSCYPDEISSCSSCDDASTFPFQFTLALSADSDTNNLTLRLDPGYPINSGVQIANYRTDSVKYKARLEAVVRAVRKVSSECEEEEIEGCIACCAIALETWNDYSLNDENDDGDDHATEQESTSVHGGGHKSSVEKHYHWISGEPLLDKKSSFQAHLCKVRSEEEVRGALQQLLTSSSKIQRASHNISAWRIAETTIQAGGEERVIIKHDNDDDGEDAAGSKLAYLLDMRKDVNVLVVVSRWYGGIHLGPKRFAHIVNVARKLLVEYTDEKAK